MAERSKAVREGSDLLRELSALLNVIPVRLIEEPSLIERGLTYELLGRQAELSSER